MSSVIDQYQKLVAAGELKPDAGQKAAAIQLDHLATLLAKPTQTVNWFDHLFNKSEKQSFIKGVYLWGKVGRGKSMLMDLFYEKAAVNPKRRVHFHAFMLEIHADIHQYRQALAGDDPISAVADTIAKSARLLCFDEMQISDVADAMILGRLFSQLLAKGVVVVATSNRAPDDLYKDGLQRQSFLSFIHLLKDHLDIIGLNGIIDYRLERLGGLPVFYTPNGEATSKALSEAFFRLTDYAVEDRLSVPAETLTVQGRPLFVPKSLKGVAVFSFKRLCGGPLGAADYLAIAERYHTVILVGVPQLNPEKRNEAKRFVLLIDALYEHKVKLLCGADAPPEQLYPAGDGSFEFERTVSRLMEMQSAAYLALGHCDSTDMEKKIQL